MLMHVITSNGQTAILEEDFSGFTTGSHSSPSTNDVCLVLDSKTSVPGWTGLRIYSAGGEIKIGTSSLTGWIETPPIDLSDTSQRFSVCFDIARWTGDATTVQIYLDGIATGGLITPSDSYQKVQIPLTSGTSASKIKIQALTRRFFLDNFSITADNVPTITIKNAEGENEILVWPIPAGEILNIQNAARYKLFTIFDLSGRQIENIVSDHQEMISIDLSCISVGIYFLYCRSEAGIKVKKIIKY